jgi:hypothetical protein
MGCTRKQKIKANADKDGKDGNFYITLSPIMIPADEITIGGVGRSPMHKVSCEIIAGGGGSTGHHESRVCPTYAPHCCGPQVDGKCPHEFSCVVNARDCPNVD